MKNRLWINLGLLGLIILLSVAVINSDKKTQKETIRLSSIDKNSINQIQVLRKDLENFIFEKKENRWFLTTPLKFRANEARINAMLGMLDTESLNQLNPDEVDLKQLGLDDPDVILKLNNIEFRFGKTDAIDQRRYVLFRNKIHLTNDFLYQQLMTNAAFFADPDLIPEEFKVSSIEYPDNKLMLINDQWQLQNILDIKPEQLRRIPFNWENAMAISAEPFKEPESASIIKITSTDNQVIQYVLVEKEPHLVLGRKDLGIQFHMGSDETDKLLLIENTKTNNESRLPGLELNQMPN